MSSRLPEPGSVALDEYELSSQIGEGAWSLIYGARSKLDGQQYAIKFLKAPEQLHGFTPERFAREFHAMRRLRSHPHILSVYRYGRWNEWTCFSMELLEGMTLQEQFRGLNPAAMDAQQYSDHLNEIYAIYEQLLDAMHYIHGQRLVHRDLKPGNLMFDSRGQIRVMDFGLAKDLEATTLTMDNPVMGTMPYMAPEQISGSEIDARADLYALGAILYELLTGRRAFEPGPNLVQALFTILEEEPVPPNSIARHVPEPLTRLCLQLLEKKPQSRPASAKAILTDLLRAKGEPEDWIESTTVILANEVIYYVPPFQGNEDVLRRLGGLVAEVREDAGRCAVLEGDVGAGKSRVAAELRSRFGRKSVHFQRASGQRDGGPLHLVVELIRGLLPYLDQMMPGWEDRLSEGARYELPDFHHDLAARFPTQSPMTVVMDGQEDRRLLVAVAELIELAATIQPLVLELDDLELADTDSLQAVEELASLLRGAHVLILLEVCTSGEPQLIALLQRLARAGHLDARLNPELLSEADTHRFIRGLISREDVPSTFSRKVYAWSGGNPLFVRELVASALSGAKTGEVMERMREERLDVPPLVRDLLDQRLRGLDDSTRRLLQAAAVVQGPFDLDLLAHLSARDEPWLRLAMATAEERRLLVSTELSGREAWRFTCPVLAEAMATELARVKCRQLHEQIAQTLEGRSEVRLSHLVARHWAAAGRPAKAALPALEGARRAREQGMADEASTCFRLAWDGIALGCFSTAESGEIRRGWIEMLTRGGDHQACLTRLQEWEDQLASGEADPVEAVGVLRSQARALHALGRGAEALLVLLRAGSKAEEVGEPRLLAGIDLQAADVMMAIGQAEESRGRVFQALARLDEQIQPGSIEGHFEEDEDRLARALGHAGDRAPDLAAELVFQLAPHLEETGRQSLAIRLLEQILLLPATVGRERVRAHQLLGRLAFRQAEQQVARGHLEAALDLCEQVGDPVLAAGCQLLLARLDLSAGRLEEALASLSAAAVAYEGARRYHELLRVWEQECEIWLDLELVERVEDVVERARELFTDQQPIAQGMLALLAGRVALARLDPIKADESFLRSERLFSSAASWARLRRVSYWRAVAHMDRGDALVARALARGLVFSCEQVGDLPLLADAHLLGLQIAQEEGGESDEAPFDAAEQVVLRLGDANRSWRLCYQGWKLYRESDPEKAQMYLSLARDTLEEIAATVPQEHRQLYRDSGERVAVWEQAVMAGL